jgi:hypothetical protein
LHLEKNSGIVGVSQRRGRGSLARQCDFQATDCRQASRAIELGEPLDPSARAEAPNALRIRGEDAGENDVRAGSACARRDGTCVMALAHVDADAL